MDGISSQNLSIPSPQVLIREEDDFLNLSSEMEDNEVEMINEEEDDEDLPLLMSSPRKRKRKRETSPLPLSPIMMIPNPLYRNNRLQDFNLTFQDEEFSNVLDTTNGSLINTTVTIEEEEEEEVEEVNSKKKKKK